MKIRFANAKLGQIRTDDAHKLGLPIAVIKRAREKLIVMEAAPDDRTLRNWKSLNYKKLEGRADLRQIRINDQYRMVFELDESTNPPTIVITEIGDTH